MMILTDDLIHCHADDLFLCHADDIIHCHAQVADARDRAERDDPPTDDCEREWQNMERRREMVQEAAERRQAEWQAIESRVGDVQTTADPRPNAYIPEQLGIPKPYSGPSTPFKPTEPGATMRLIRKPEIREIII